MRNLIHAGLLTLTLAACAAGPAFAHPRAVALHPIPHSDVVRIEAAIRYQLEGRWGALFDDYIVGARKRTTVCVCGAVELRSTGRLHYVARLSPRGVWVVTVGDDPVVEVSDWCVTQDVLVRAY